MVEKIRRRRSEEERLVSALSRSLGDAPSVVVAVSGGLDSVTLLHASLRLRERRPLTLTVGHVDHGLRPESSAEAQFVMTAAAGLGLPCVVKTAPPIPPDANLESWAREIRYRLLEEIRVEAGAELILTAHHADDQAETVLMRIISGRAATGGAAMVPKLVERRIVRPFIAIEKSVLERCAAAAGLSHVTDATNSDPARMRNRIRSRLLPLIARDYNPAIVDTLGELGSRLLADDAYLEEAAVSAAAQIDGTLTSVRRIPEALAWRALRVHLGTQMGPEAARRVGFRALARLAAAVQREGAQEQTIELGGGLSALVSKREGLRFRTGSAAAPEDRSDEPVPTVPATVFRTYRDGSGWELRFALREAHNEERPDGSGEDRVTFDLDRLSGSSLTVGARREGEWIDLPGRGRRRVKKLFRESGVPLTLRDRIPIVRSDLRVLWIPGVARSSLAAVDERSARLLDISYRRTT